MSTKSMGFKFCKTLQNENSTVDIKNSQTAHFARIVEPYI